MKKYLPKLATKCEKCGKTFYIFPYRIKSAKYCSRKCQKLAYKGKRLSPGTEFKKGIRYSPETEFKRGHKLFVGALSPNWKGGKSSLRNRAESQMEYKEWRKAVFKRDNWTCVACKIRGGILHADHIKMWSTHPHLRYEISNGQTLCKKCHRAKTSEDLGVNKKVFHALKELVEEGLIARREVVINGEIFYEYKIIS